MSNPEPGTPRTVAAHLLRAAHECGAEYIFTNLGSDHPAFIQAFAEMDGREDCPAVICCPHEMTALSAAHGHAMLSRRAQLVLVHVDVGTQNLGSSVHNAARGRIPAFIIASKPLPTTRRMPSAPRTARAATSSPTPRHGTGWGARPAR